MKDILEPITLNKNSFSRTNIFECTGFKRNEYINNKSTFDLLFEYSKNHTIYNKLDYVENFDLYFYKKIDKYEKGKSEIKSNDFHKNDRISMYKNSNVNEDILFDIDINIKHSNKSKNLCNTFQLLYFN